CHEPLPQSVLGPHRHPLRPADLPVADGARRARHHPTVEGTGASAGRAGHRRSDPVALVDEDEGRLPVPHRPREAPPHPQPRPPSPLRHAPAAARVVPRRRPSLCFPPPHPPRRRPRRRRPPAEGGERFPPAPKTSPTPRRTGRRTPAASDSSAPPDAANAS